MSQTAEKMKRTITKEKREKSNLNKVEKRAQDRRSRDDDGKASFGSTKTPHKNIITKEKRLQYNLNKVEKRAREGKRSLITQSKRKEYNANRRKNYKKPNRGNCEY